MKLLIRNGRLIDPANQFDAITDILIENGKIARIGQKLPAEKKVIDARNRWIIPGLVDLHTHLREPGYEYKETIETGTQSAVAGGFCSICCMPNTNPVNDNEAITRFILDRAHQIGRVRIYPIGAITKGSFGKELAEIGELVKAGCRAISDDGRPVTNSEVMRRALEYSKIFNIPVINHCEDPQLVGDGVMNEGIVSLDLGLKGIPAVAEEVMVARDLLLAEQTGGNLHLAHVSTGGSVRMIREAKQRAIKVTAEACPHHFMLTEEAVRDYNTAAKVSPPLRTQADVQAIREGLADGTIDAIATDHAPHAEEEKQCEFDQAPFGMVGLETALSLTLGLVEAGVLTLEQAVARLTIQPARIMRLNAGHLGVGADADIALIDPENRWVVEPKKLHSKSKNTAFKGWKMTGRVVMTLMGGRVVYSTEETSTS
jgi:dihydroorotase